MASGMTHSSDLWDVSDAWESLLREFCPSDKYHIEREAIPNSFLLILKAAQLKTYRRGVNFLHVFNQAAEPQFMYLDWLNMENKLSARMMDEAEKWEWDDIIIGDKAYHGMITIGPYVQFYYFEKDLMPKPVWVNGEITLHIDKDRAAVREMIGTIQDEWKC